MHDTNKLFRVLFFSCATSGQGIDKCLTEQLQYLTQVSTMQPHEGSVYGPEKVEEFCTISNYTIPYPLYLISPPLSLSSATSS